MLKSLTIQMNTFMVIEYVSPAGIVLIDGNYVLVGIDELKYWEADEQRYEKYGVKIITKILHKEK